MYNDGVEHKIGDLVEVIHGFWDEKDSYIGKLAIISGTYASQYGGNDHNSLRLTFENGDRSSWWYPSKLKLVERGQISLLIKWEQESIELEKIESDLDYIFQNIDLVLENKSGASLQAVYSYVGGGSLWGTRGEGITYYENSYSVLMLLAIFNNTELTKTKESFLEFSKDFIRDVSK